MAPIDEFLGQGARVMWCAAHPDDECFGGTILARASLHYGNPLHMLVMTRGDGGECCIPEGCHPDVPTVRAGEMERVARMYRGSLQLESYFNAPLPMSSFPKRHEINDIWKARKAPLQLVATAMRRFKPDLLLTFDPYRGATGHPEHQLTSRIATTAVRMAADPGVDLEGLAPHRVERTYWLQSRYWLMRMLGQADPGPVTEVFDATLPAAAGLSCVDFMCYATEQHRTQLNDMGLVRRMRTAFNQANLRQVDPFSITVDPGEIEI
jgi:LmbE family N-acetylglucosaminyl deacetylase